LAVSEACLIEAEGLGRRHGAQWVIRGLTFEVLPGQVLAVTGSNGSGKSTLLRLIAGLIEPNEGRLTVGDGSVGMAALDMALYPALTAREHLEWASQMAGRRGFDSLDALGQVGLAAAAGKTPLQLSTGMKARLKLALAVVGEPAVLLLDEPTAALDETGKGLIGQVVEQQLGRGCVVMATNDRDDMQWATHELALA
jgi:ABC-type multidrug transport system ATPase subunit